MQTQNRSIIKHVELIGQVIDVRLYDEFYDKENNIQWMCRSVIVKRKRWDKVEYSYMFFPSERIYKENGIYKRRKNLTLCLKDIRTYLLKKDWIPVTITMRNLGVLRYDQNTQ